MKKIKKLVRRNNELEEEINSTRNGYEEEITILVEKNDDLTRKLGVFMGDSAPKKDNQHIRCLRDVTMDLPSHRSSLS